MPVLMQGAEGSHLAGQVGWFGLWFMRGRPLTIATQDGEEGVVSGPLAHLPREEAWWGHGSSLQNGTQGGALR